MTDTDIVIIGGGIAGLTVAKGIVEQTDFSVTLIDSKLEANMRRPVDFDARVIALAKRSVEEIRRWGVTLPESVAIKHIEVSDKGAAGLCELSADKFGLTEFGEVVALQRLGEALFSSLQTSRLKRITTSVENISVSQNNHQLHLANKSSLNCKLVIIADGGRSSVSQSLGFSYQQTAYQQTAIICNVKMSERHENKAFERFTANGPLAFLPFTSSPQENTKNEYSVVWTIAKDQADRLLNLSDGHFIQQLQKAFGYRKGRILTVGKKDAFPLALRHADRLIQHRSVVVGNAAQTLHPIAGQGFNLGVRDAVSLVDALKPVADPGAFDALNIYQQTRKADRSNTIGLTDSLVTLFSTSLAPLRIARNIGLLGMNVSHSVQSQFVKQTTGFN
ncbi:2-octaprenyl-6-methoxyphenyl hydroxylase [Alteromonas sp. ASW11-130]|uniref:2-octaprenyl-6-methoxyphenyl hydroxylase n=1 Tax=Alteromonas sp. ASW11-130 TaxID=3015775 RepID=UPI002241D8F9|nr:2-octaprenyl-6-methoxyphenyl hydroxylase [Alteromonas sp. ASW11-130]MCW8091579.1 2-octaprenyl-6-methoxyphenyl hydroxylase [Alteromonas sp. ASW11-130]